MEIWEAIVLHRTRIGGFLPVSSSGHLVIGSELLGIAWRNQRLPLLFMPQPFKHHCYSMKKS